jgi:hypothetical protein
LTNWALPHDKEGGEVELEVAVGVGEAVAEVDVVAVVEVAVGVGDAVAEVDVVAVAVGVGDAVAEVDVVEVVGVGDGDLNGFPGGDDEGRATAAPAQSATIPTEAANRAMA